MAEFEVDISGEEVEVVCPNCDGEGELTSNNNYKAFVVDKNEWKEKECTKKCPVCKGEGVIMAIANDTVFVHLEPRYNMW